MTKEEFEVRSIKVNDSDFEAINKVFMNSGLDIDEFCKQWCDVNKKRVENYWKLDTWMREHSAICDMIIGISERFGYDNHEVAADLLTKEEIIALEMADIKVVREHPIKFVNSKGVIEYRPNLKLMCEIVYEVRGYMKSV